MKIKIKSALMVICMLAATPLAKAQIFTAIADAHVAETSPNNNNGSLKRLQLRSGALGKKSIAYIKFEVQGLQGKVRLARLKVKTKSADGLVNVHAISDNNWVETDITWNKKPALTSVIDTITAYSGQWITLDVTKAIKGDGIYTFALTSSADTDSRSDFSSRHTGAAPILDIGTDHVLDWQVVKTVYPTDDVVVAGVVMDASRLPYDPENEDCSPAIQKALDEVGAAGGGTVFLPVGIYRCDAVIDFPMDVHLRGDWGKITDKDKTVRGTILKVIYNGMHTNESPPFIQLNYRSGLQNLSIWYPNQSLSSVVPYAATIGVTDSLIAEIRIENVNLVNCYRSFILNTSNLRSNINGIYGSPLNMGLYQQASRDIPSFSRVYFSSEYWAQSGLKNAPKRSELMEYMKNNTTGIKIDASDNILANELHVADCQIGFHFTEYPGEGTMNGMVYGWSSKNCVIGLLADPIGDTRFINCHFSGDTAVELKGQTMDLFFNGCFFESTVSSYDLIDGRDKRLVYLHFQNCRFKNKIDVPKGHLSIVNSTFDYVGDIPIELDKLTQSAVLAGNTFAYKGDPIKLKRTDPSKVLIDKNPTYSEKFLPFDAEGYDQIRKPADTHMIVIGSRGYEVAVDGTTDDAPVLQLALNDVAALGGGIVMVPQLCDAGYAIRSPLRIPPGVELRASAEGKHSLRAAQNMPGALFQIYYGRGGSDPAITLQKGSGFRGFTIYYPEQLINDLTPYAPAIHIAGDDAYVQNIQSVNATDFILCTNSTNVLLERLTADHTDRLFKLVNCTNSRINSVNIYGEWDDTGLGPYLEQDIRLMEHGMAHCLAYEIIDSSNIEIFSTFGRACYLGGRFINSSVHTLQFSFESYSNGIEIDGIPSGKRVELLGSSMRVDRDYKESEKIFLDVKGNSDSGAFRLISSMLDGYPDTILKSTNLDCTLQQCAFVMDRFKMAKQGVHLDGDEPAVTRIENCAIDFPHLFTDIANISGKRLEMVGNICMAGLEYPQNSTQYLDSVDPLEISPKIRFAAVANLVTPRVSTPFHSTPIDGGMTLLSIDFETEYFEHDALQYMFGYRPSETSSNLVFEVTSQLFDEKYKSTSVGIQFGYYSKEAGTVSVEYQLPKADWVVVDTLKLKDETAETKFETKVIKVSENLLQQGTRIRLVLQSGNALFSFISVNGKDLLPIPFGT
ncbi:MAG: DNRLRE domain-containing protein [Verrucomicrobiota bacterium]